MNPTSTPYPLALPRVEGPVFVLNKEHLQQGINASRESPRKRIMLPMHRTTTEGVQRMVNYLQRDSYIKPHQHPMPECIENLAVLQGAMGVLAFDEEGNVLEAHRLVANDAASCMIDIEQGVWHTLVPLADDTVVLEIKRGPYDAKTDKAFAKWAPDEGTPESLAWLKAIIAKYFS
jgi:cupin fold WbuC family metalloprotein